MKVLKFGGSSVGSPERIKSVIDIVLAEMGDDDEIVVIFSAFAKVTNGLIEMANLAVEHNDAYLNIFADLRERHFDAISELIPASSDRAARTYVKELMDDLKSILYGIYLVHEVSKRTLDYIMSFGERLSAYIIAEAFKEKQKDVCFIDTRDVILTDDNFGDARVDIDKSYANIVESCRCLGIKVVTGFIGSTHNKETSTIGRGGSDYTASLFAAALDADELQVWTDVDGVMTADPNKVERAFPLQRMTYEEAMEISYFGAKVIHPPTMHPVLTKKIPLHIKNTLNFTAAGTLITAESSGDSSMIKGISSIDDISFLRLQGSGMVGVRGVSQRLFSALASSNVNVILITQASSEHSICVAVTPGEAPRAKKAIEEEFSLEMYAHQIDGVQVEQNLSIVAIVGENMRRNSGISARLFGSLGGNGVNVVAIAQGSSELNISVVIAKQNLIKALNVIHEAFFLSDTQTLNVFMVGAGLIGTTLLEQIGERAGVLMQKRNLDLRLVALANSKKMIFGAPVIGWESAKERLKAATVIMNPEVFVREMCRRNMANSVFVDCTASEALVPYYADILNNSIAIVTPNKKANSGPYQRYKTFQDIVVKKGVRYLYETNVGAGLPVIGALKDLIESGDSVLKIEAVLSGTLSYIFNSYDGSTTFSQVVAEAKDKGYTEPDPRDDLNGMDVARKLLILARESGYSLEPKDIEVESLLTEDCIKASSVEEFFKVFAKRDEFFAEKISAAQRENKVLRYVAKFEKGGKATVSLQALPVDHPFANLSGSDNMVVFTTKRYKEYPLIIRGPGAGAAVTAAGVFADIMRLA